MSGRRDLAVVLALVFGATAAPAAPIPDYAAVVEAIACETYGRDVFHPLRDLGPARVVLAEEQPRKEPAGTKSGEPFTATCENTVAWKLFLAPPRTDVGPLLVAVCDAKELPPKNLEWAREQHDRMAKSAADVPDGAPATDAPIASRPSRRDRIDDGKEVLFFHVLTIGHGVFQTPSLFLTDRRARRTVVVQLDPDELCEERPTIELCTDTATAMRKLASRVATTFSDGPDHTPAPDPSAAAPCREPDPYSRFHAALSPEGHKRDTQLLNAIGVGRGRARLLEFIDEMTGDGAEAYARFLNRASDADIERVVDRLNTAPKLDLTTRWWEPAR
jgi:hypothetical protein